MQPKRLRTDNLPPPHPPRLTLVTTDSARDSARVQKRRSNRILAWSVLASLGVNALLVVLISRADLFGQTRSVQTVKHLRVQVYRPPVRKPPVTAPVPPKPRATAVPPPPRTPRLRHSDRTVSVKPPVVRPQPVGRPQAPAPQAHAPAPPTPRVQTPRPRIHSTPTPAAPPTLTPTRTAARPTGPRTMPSTPHLLPTHAAPTMPTAPRFAPPVTLSPGSLPTPTAPAKHEDPPTPPARHEAPPPPAVRHETVTAPAPRDPTPVRREEPKRPANWVPVETQDAEVKSVPDPNTDGIDAADVHGSCIISFEISESGRVSNVGIRKSSGNADFDRACEEAMRHARCAPAVQDHIPQVQRMTHPFSP